MFEKLKEIFKPKNQKKTASNLIVLLFSGAILILVSNMFLSDKNTSNSLIPSEKNHLSVEQQESNQIEDYENTIESKLEIILKEIKGVGNVHVMITLEDTAEKVPVFNTTQMIEKTDEKDAQGGVRETTREDVTKQIAFGSGNDSLVIVKETKPKVRGVIVVAEGAEDIAIKEKLYSAVKTVLGITGNKVEIYSSK